MGYVRNYSYLCSYSNDNLKAPFSAFGLWGFVKFKELSYA